MCGSGVMSWVKNQRIATRRFSSSTPSRSAHSTCRSAGQLASATSSAKYSACRCATSAPAPPAASRSAASSRTVTSMRKRGSTSFGDDADEAVAGERVEQVERLVLRAAADTAWRRRASSRRRTPTGPPRARAPASSRSPKLHSTVARRVRWRSGRSTRSRAQRVEDVFEPGEQRGGCEHPGAGRGELDRQRQPVEAPADLRHRGRVRVVQREVVAHRPGPVDEEPHRGQRRELVERRPLGERRHRQRLDRVLPLSASRSSGAARGEDRDVGARGQELVELGRHAGHLLEVVEHQQRRGRREVLDQRVERRARALDRRTHGRGDARQHQRGIGDRRERARTPCGVRLRRARRRPRSPAASCRCRPGR